MGITKRWECNGVCGIAGQVGGDSIEHLNSILPRMLASMAHRGPDGSGVWVDAAGTCGLAHQRLAIIDPGGGHQPLTNEDQTLWITFNGCIYNYKEIREQLHSKGHRFRTQSDTEVIVHAYEEWGPACVSRFNGMWAFAIWDDRQKSLFCSRDRVGIKPFYYTWNHSVFTFGSEIKALLAAGVWTDRPDPEGLRQYLTFQFCLGERTLFSGIYKLLPGHNLLLQQGREPQINCYWDLDFDIDEERSEEDFSEELLQLLQDSVRLRLRSDVPLGAHLSGGLDSSTIACLTRTLLGNESLSTFTGAFREGSGFDETPYAKMACKHIEANYHETYLGPEDFAGSIEKIIWHMDEPAAGPGVFPQFGVSKLASEHVKVVLGGQGGDELFIGYARYLVAYLEECIKGAIQNTAHRTRYVATLETIVPNLPSLEHYTPMLKSFWREGLFDDPAQRYFRLMDRFGDTQAVLNKDFVVDRERTFEEFRSIFDHRHAASKINRILYFDMKTHLQALLQVEDRASMAWGLESRVPLLDHRLIELLSSIPPVIKFKNGQLKSLFRRAVKDLVPSNILNRSDKMGFPVPLSQWFRNDLHDFTCDLLLSRKSKERNLFNPRALEAAIRSDQPYSRTIWGALCLELWHRQFIDSPVLP